MNVDVSLTNHQVPNLPMPIRRRRSTEAVALHARISFRMPCRMASAQYNLSSLHCQLTDQDCPAARAKVEAEPEISMIVAKYTELF